VLEALGKPSTNVPFMMPARIAATSPDEQIKEIVGSGPFKFVKEEWQPGNQAVYVHNPDYARARRRQAVRPAARKPMSTR
jgi:peptide/nickel transport system substrate-binding protein